MEPFPCLGNTIMCVEALPLPPRKSFEDWKTSWLRALEEDRIHCPGCVDQERQAIVWMSKVLDIKSNRTPQEEQELKLHRQKLSFLDCVYDIVCKIHAMKEEIKLKLRIAVNQLKKKSFEPVMVVVVTAAPAAVTTTPTQVAEAEKVLYDC